MEPERKKKKRENTITFLFLSNTLVQNEFLGPKTILLKKIEFSVTTWHLTLQH